MFYEKKNFKISRRIYKRLIIFLFGIIVGLLISIIFINNYQPKIDVSQNISQDSNISKPIIKIDSIDEINKIRQNLINFIWGNDYLPDGYPKIEKNIKPPYEPLGMESADRLIVEMEYELFSIAYLFHPINPNGRILIYHQGHENELDLSRPVVEFFLAKGYRVLTLCMPLFCENNISTVELPRFGLMQINNHDKMAFLDRPFHYFFEPITLCLNYIEKQYKPSLISMTGLSGGGWTTTVYAAIDSRIKYSFPVAGSLPISLRQSRDWGDFEQTYPSLYEIANYYELYTIGASNGKQVQILNKFDSCCFALDNIPGYVKEVDKKARLFFGTFSFYLDDSHHEHTLSSSAMKVIEENLP